MMAEGGVPSKVSKREKTINRLFVNWIGWKVVLPLLLILSIYVLIRFILDIPESFGRAFAHGDLLIFSALVLLEAATEGEYVNEESTKMMAVRLTAKILAILFIVGFVATKSDVLHKEYDLFILSTKVGEELGTKMLEEILTKKKLAYSCLNCVVALVSVVGSIVLFWFNIHSEKEQEYESLGQR